LDTLITVNAVLAGFFACAAIHYAVHWWLSRDERVFLVFAVQCAMYAAFSLAITAFFRARTIPDAQATLGRFVTIGVLVHALVLELYADLGRRRDRAFRALVTGGLVFLAVLNQWAPLRGTVLELRTISLPGGGTSLLAIRTPPGASLAFLYLLVLAITGYGFFVARAIWKHDRAGAILVASGAAAPLGGAIIAILVDFAKLRAPYAGALPHAINVLCLAFFLSREYAARGARLRSHRERLEDLVATRTRELGAAKDEAERANRAKSQFLAHISHEIRNPLHLILGYAQLLERDPALAGPQRKQVGIVHSSGNHLLALMDDLLEMAKLEARRPELVETPFDPWATLDEVERMFAGEAGSKGVAIAIECAPGLPRSMLGDGAKVRQILINLASNAFKFTERGSIRFTASATPCGDGPDGRILATIVVADTGIGIAAQDAVRIFHAFEQLDAGKRAGGTGLGLAISLGYARLMGGDLTVASAPGIGSSFTFTFAAKSIRPAAATAAREPIAQVVAGATRVKVLIVDDVEVNRDVLAELLSGPCFETRTAADGTGAISIHADWHPDLVLIDLRMPGMGGLEAIRHMRAAGSRAAIGALSASALEEDERESLALGADFFVRKPYDDRELMDRITRVLVMPPGAGDPQSRALGSQVASEYDRA
jgi:signal transduction histidine kinase/CheY-like chemotaxis protein